MNFPPQSIAFGLVILFVGCLAVSASRPSNDIVEKAQQASPILRKLSYTVFLFCIAVIFAATILFIASRFQ